MVDGSEDTVAFRLWPPVAIGAPLLVGWLVTLLWGDPVDLGGWRVALGWALVLLFVGWNGWSLWLFGRHETGLLPGQATHAMIEEGPYRLSRNPLYVGLLALYLGLVPTALAYVLFARGLQKLPAASVATLTLAEPLTAATLGVAVLGERPGPVAGLGALLVLSGLLVLSAQPRRRPATA